MMDLKDATGHWQLDPAGSSVEFHVKHFWGVITVHGRFEKLDGEATIDGDGNVSGRLTIDANSLTTRNRKRDEHLRSADFFDVKNHPTVTMTLQELAPDGESAFRAQVALKAAGRVLLLEPRIEVASETSDTVTLRSTFVVDRTAFAMTWSPLGMASREARGEVTVRFVRR
jgi:polyisoprenoid-binding protein YceI